MGSMWLGRSTPSLESLLPLSCVPPMPPTALTGAAVAKLWSCIEVLSEKGQLTVPGSLVSQPQPLLTRLDT